MNDKAVDESEQALWDAAVEAEIRTGRHETTAAQAKSHLMIRIVRVCCGAAVLLAGVALTILPGPGLVLIVAGLTILAVDVPFAARLRDVLVERADRATSFIPKRFKRALVVGLTVVGVGFSALLLAR